MFGISMPEMLLILAIALIVIGPKKLPDLARSLGRALGEFKKATSDLKRSLDETGEIKEVRKAFQELNTDIKETMADKPGTSQGDAPPNAGQPEPPAGTDSAPVTSPPTSRDLPRDA